MSAAITLRPARAGEAAALSVIAQAAKAHWGYPPEWLADWQPGLTLSEAELQASHVIVAEAEGRLLGFAALRMVEGLAELEHCWVLPDAMGQGVGRALMAAMRRDSLAQGQPHIKLLADPNAEAFYRHLGARTVGRADSTPAGRKLPVMLLQNAQPLPSGVLAPYWFGQLPYVPTWRAMQAYTSARDGESPDELWLLEHPPVFTQGQAGKPEHVLQLSDIPVVPIDRGGQVTYHGPGQLVGYLMVDLSRRKLGVREYVRRIEQSIIDLLAEFGIEAYGKVDAPGVYVNEAKIAALGLRIRNGKSYHGLSLNVGMDLAPFGQINPCGYAGLQVTQLADFGIKETPASLAPRLAAKINALLALEGTASVADYALSSKPVAA